MPQAIESPFPQFFDLDGSPLDAGYLYFGVENQNPETSPAPIYWDVSGTQPAPQPVRTMNGFAVRTSSPAPVFANGNYSLTVKNKIGITVFYAASSSQFSSISTLQASLADTSDPAKGDALLGVKRAGGVARTQHDVNEERYVSITDFGGQPGLAFNNTTAFNACLAYLGATGGTIYFPPGNWRGNFVVNQHGITLMGSGGGVGELLVSDASATMLRPFTTGVGAATVRLSNKTRVNRKIGLSRIVISGDDGAGNQAARCLWVDGGTVNLWANQVDLMGGTQTLAIDPGGTYPATALKFHQLTIRNDLTDAASRAIYVRKYADATGYVTDLYFSQLKVNKPLGGYWLEVDGTGSTGLVVHFGQGYVDHGAGFGILTSASGLEVIECDGGIQIDPGAPGTVIMKRQDLVKDLSRFWRGHIEGAGGQKIQFADSSTVTLPVEPGFISYQPLSRNMFMIGPYRYTNANNPFGLDCPYDDLTGANGFMLFKQGLGRGMETDVGLSRWLHGMSEQELTLSTAGVITNGPSNILPDNSIIEAVTWRVTAAIVGAASFSIGDPTTAARFASASTGIALGSTGVGLAHVDQTGAAGPKQISGNNVRITTNTTPSAGKIRITVFYRQFVAPTA